MRRLLLPAVIALPGVLAAQSSHSIDTARIAHLVDSIRTEQGVPGVAFAIVSANGTVLRGFGTSRTAQGSQIDPERTPFRLASVAKLFVATAAARAVHEGRLSYDAPVREAMRDVTVPATYPGAITLRHLLTHTAGFDERLTGYVIPQGEQMPALREQVIRGMPRRVRPAGMVTSYSNYGASLAAYAVEAATGESFDSYLERRVFLPLQMVRTSYHTAPDSLASIAAIGHRCVKRVCEVVSAPRSALYPPGLAFSTAGDMARFLGFHLGLAGARGDDVLPAARRDELQRQHFTNDPRLPGMGYGFFEERRRGLQLWSHGGAVPGFASLAVLIPGRQLGFFIVNNGGSGPLNAEVMDSLIAMLGTERASMPIRPLTDDDRAFEGQYLTTRAQRGSVERFPGLFVNDKLSVNTVGDTLRVRLPNGRILVLAKADEGLFRGLDGDEVVVLRTGDDGLRRAFLSLRVGGAGFPAAFEQLPWYGEPYFVNEYVSWLVFAPWLILIGWGASRFLWWMMARTKPTYVRGTRSWALWVAASSALAGSVAMPFFGFAFMAQSTRGLESGSGLVLGVTPALERLALLPWAVALSAAVLLMSVGLLWRRREGRLGDRLAASALAAAGMLSVMFLATWNYLPLKW